MGHYYVDFACEKCGKIACNCTLKEIQKWRKKQVNDQKKIKNKQKKK